MFAVPALAQASGLEKFAGAYQATAVTIFHVRAAGDTLLVQFGRGPRMALTPEGPGRFTDAASGAQFVFSDDGMALTASRDIHVFQARRISDAQAQALEDAIAARFKADRPSPGTEDSVRRYIASLERGAPDYDEMEPRVAEETRQSLPADLATIRKMGTLKSLTFVAVNPTGEDVYDAAFEHGHVMVGPAPLDADGKVQFRSWSPRD